MKVCPFCGKEILAVAKMCKYCREWLPIEAANTVVSQNSVEKGKSNTGECTSDGNRTEHVQTTILSKEERNARIEELDNEIYLLEVVEKPKAEESGLNVKDIEDKIDKLEKERDRLDLEKGLEEGYWVRTEDGTIISNKKIDFPYHPYRPFVLIGIAVIVIVAVIIFLTHR